MEDETPPPEVGLPPFSSLYRADGPLGTPDLLPILGTYLMRALGKKRVGRIHRVSLHPFTPKHSR